MAATTEHQPVPGIARDEAERRVGTLVMKFGGTSVGNAERMCAVAGITAEQARRRPVALVVSAMAKITDLLLETLRRAEDLDIDTWAPGTRDTFVRVRADLVFGREIIRP